MSLAAALVLFLLASSAHSQGLVFHTAFGVVMPVPPGFVQVPKETLLGTKPGAADRVEAVFQHVDGTVGVTIVVLNLPTNNTRELLAELPAQSGPVRRDLAESVANGMIRTSPDAWRGAQIVPLLYDNARKAYGVEVVSEGLSDAQTLLLKPDSSAEWQEISRELVGNGSMTLPLYRCVLTAVSETYAQGPVAVTAETAKRCHLTSVASATYTKGIDASVFQPRHAVVRLLTVACRGGQTLIKFDTDGAGREPLDSAWSTIWTGLRVPQSAAPPTGPTSRLSFSNYNPRYLLRNALGMLVVAVVFGGVFGNLISRLSVKPIPAAILGQIVAVGLALVLSSGGLEDGSITGLGLIRLLASFATFAVVLRSVRRRQERLAGRAEQ